MERDFGKEANELYEVLDQALERSDLLRLREVLSDFIELAADNLEQQPDNLTAVHVLADMLDEAGTIEAIKNM